MGASRRGGAPLEVPETGHEKWINADPGSRWKSAWAEPMCPQNPTHLLQESMLSSLFSRVQFFATLWTVVCQAPLPMQFSRQEYWSGLPFPLPGDLPDPGIEPTSLMSPGLAGRFFTISTTWDTILPALHRLILQITRIIATITVLIYR